MKSKRVRVLIADGHPVVREGIAACLAAVREIEVVGEACDATEVGLLVRCLQPDVVLMDLQLKGVAGIEVVEDLLRAAPRCAVLMFSAIADMELMHRLFQVGVRGYVLKCTSPTELVDGVLTVGNGARFLSSSLRARAGRSNEPKLPLSFRESQVLTQLALGRSTKGISEVLGMRIRTVEKHRNNMRRKLSISSLPALVRYAVDSIHLSPFTGGHGADAVPQMDSVKPKGAGVASGEKVCSA